MSGGIFFRRSRSNRISSSHASETLRLNRPLSSSSTVPLENRTGEPRKLKCTSFMVTIAIVEHELAADVIHR